MLPSSSLNCDNANNSSLHSFCSACLLPVGESSAEAKDDGMGVSISRLDDLKSLNPRPLLSASDRARVSSIVPGELGALTSGLDVLGLGALTSVLDELGTLSSCRVSMRPYLGSVESAEMGLPASNEKRAGFLVDEGCPIGLFGSSTALV